MISLVMYPLSFHLCIFVTLLCCCLVIASGREFYDIVKVRSKDDPAIFKYYLLYNNVSRQIPDEKTITSLNFSISNLVEMSLDTMLASHKLNEQNTIPLMDSNIKTPDDAVNFYVIKSTIFNGNLLQNVQVVGNYINPSVINFLDGKMLIAPTQVGLSGKLHESV